MSKEQLMIQFLSVPGNIWSLSLSEDDLTLPALNPLFCFYFCHPFLPPPKEQSHQVHQVACVLLCVCVTNQTYGRWCQYAWSILVQTKRTKAGQHTIECVLFFVLSIFLFPRYAHRHSLYICSVFLPACSHLYNPISTLFLFVEMYKTMCNNHWWQLSSPNAVPQWRRPEIVYNLLPARAYPGG